MNARAPEVGQRWEFVSGVNGSVKTYEVETVEQPCNGRLVSLRNLDGGGIARITVRWLLGLSSNGDSYWRKASTSKTGEAS